MTSGPAMVALDVAISPRHPNPSIAIFKYSGWNSSIQSRIQSPESRAHNTEYEYYSVLILVCRLASRIMPGPAGGMCELVQPAPTNAIGQCGTLLCDRLSSIFLVPFGRCLKKFELCGDTRGSDDPDSSTSRRLMNSVYSSGWEDSPGISVNRQ